MSPEQEPKMEQTLLRTPENIQLEYEVDEYLELYNDTTTWLAETLNGNMQTKFEFKFNGTDLISDDGRNLRTVFDDALTDVDKLIDQTPTLTFERSRRELERQEYDVMCGMAKGELPNTMFLVTEFPEALKTATKNIGGYDVNRQHDMLRVIKCLPNGKISIATQTLDNTTPNSIEAIYNKFGSKIDHTKSYLGQRAFKDLSQEAQDKLINELVAAHDQALTKQFGGEWQAGRKGEDHQNTYNFVRSQADLVDNFVRRWLVNGVNENEMYNLAAAIEKRYIGDYSYASSEMGASGESAAAGQDSRVSGKSYDGCGLSLSVSNSNDSLSQLGYGNTIKKMHCPFCKSGVWGDPCASRIKCGDCKAEVKDGKIINKGNSKNKKSKKRLGKTATKATFWEKLYPKSKR